ncbi:ankyrin repeat domain-containing protein [Bacillus salacetis]|uniref:ankyrin repeat domain-containing protein n=1 Tax=Bacillus salacetis TaxID=2315464 RepID=UPI003BA3C225
MNVYAASDYCIQKKPLLHIIEPANADEKSAKCGALSHLCPAVSFRACLILINPAKKNTQHRRGCMDFYEILEKQDLLMLEKYIEKHGVNHVLNDQSILMLAVREGNLKVTKMLLEQGAKVNWVDNLNRNALMIASFFGYSNIVKLLLNHGATEFEKAYKFAEKGWNGDRQIAVIQVLSEVKD